MKDLEKQIEDAAKDYGQREGMFLSITKAVAFAAGAKSNAAKEFHQQGMYSEKEVEVLMEKSIDKGMELNVNYKVIHKEQHITKWIEQNKKQ